MVSREFLYSKVKNHHTISIHMKGVKRLDGLCTEIYVIYELLLDKSQEEELVRNILNKKDTEGVLRVKAVKTSEVDISLQDLEPKEYLINTKDICCYEML